MIGANIAPGLSRSFASEGWDFIDDDIWKEERKRAFDAIDAKADLKIYASDIEGKAVKISIENAAEAGTGDLIYFHRSDIKDALSKMEGEGGVIITNPPYGERIGDEKDIAHIYDSLGRFMEDNKTWSLFMITSDKDAEKKTLGRKADRRRKLYNGRMEVCYYQFHGERPAKKYE